MISNCSSTAPAVPYGAAIPPFAKEGWTLSLNHLLGNNRSFIGGEVKQRLFHAWGIRRENLHPLREYCRPKPFLRVIA